jgi:hypothetical protein
MHYFILQLKVREDFLLQLKVCLRMHYFILQLKVREDFLLQLKVCLRMHYFILQLKVREDFLLQLKVRLRVHYFILQLEVGEDFLLQMVSVHHPLVLWGGPLGPNEVGEGLHLGVEVGLVKERDRDAPLRPATYTK